MKLTSRIYPLTMIFCLIMCVSIACGSSTGDIPSEAKDAPQQSNNVSSSTNEFTPTPYSTDKPEPTKTQTSTPNPNLIPSGTHLIGSEMKAGLYKGQEEGCYWERLKDLSGSFDAIISNGNSDGQFYVDIDESDMAFSASCPVIMIDPLPELVGEFPKLINPGMYLVGSEIKPGIYFGKDEGCYWERLKNLSGDFNGIVANGNSDGQFYIKLLEQDYAFSISCDASLLESFEPPANGYLKSFNPGMYLVGKDIEPGRYKGTDEGCYWERLRDFTGGFDSIIANGNSDGQFYIQVSENDYAISTSCKIEKVLD